jgi:hypothetical protein
MIVRDASPNRFNNWLNNTLRDVDDMRGALEVIVYSDVKPHVRTLKNLNLR